MVEDRFGALDKTVLADSAVPATTENPHALVAILFGSGFGAIANRIETLPVLSDATRQRRVSELKRIDAA